MSDIAIRVEHLSKQYQLGKQQKAYSTFRETLASTATAPLRWLKGERRQTDNTFWALNDVSFEIKHGEAVGIIGRNGAGKSTLLKILSRITKPTRGRVELFGRVGSLLEVGTGFHPELTGRENIYLNGAILGMSRQEIKRKFDEIVAFAEVEKFLDTPVKFYSSGMYVRLAFAVAAHLEPEILVVDEVLAVGDAEFQKKSLGKMDDVTHAGRTVLFVSHNMSAVNQLCKTALLLQDGLITKNGPVNDVVVNYLASGSMQSNGVADVSGPSWRLHSYSATESQFKWTKVALINSAGIISPNILFGEIFELVLDGFAAKPLLRIKPHFGLRTATGIIVFNTWGTDMDCPTSFPSGTIRFRAKINPNFLAPGRYEIEIGASGSNVQDVIGPFSFEILPTPFSDQHVWNDKQRGILADPCTWSFDGVLQDIR